MAALSASSAERSAQEDPVVQAFWFTGPAGTYFRIWTVGFALSVLTLGAYAPWAHVRAKRYLYENTWLAGSRLGYDGDPRRIVQRLLLRFGGIAPLWVAAQYVFPLFLMLAGALALAVPWSRVRVLRRDAGDISWRGLKASFHGTVGQAYMAYAKSAGVLVLTLGLGGPWAIWNLHRFVVGNLRVDGEPVVLETNAGRFVEVCFATGFIVGLSTWGYYRIIDYIEEKLFLYDWEDHVQILILVSLHFVLLTYHVTRRFNLKAKVRFGKMRLGARLGFFGSLSSQVINTSALVASVGLATPWVQLRRHRHLMTSMALHARPADLPRVTSADLRRWSQPPWVHGLEANTAAVGGSVAVLFAVVFLLFSYAVPFGSRLIGLSLAGESIVQVLGEVEREVVAEELFLPSWTSEEGQERAHRVLDGLRPLAPDLPLRMDFGNALHSNAMVLLDGTIIPSDQLLEILTDDELAAVIAHEIGHLHHHHSNTFNVLSFWALAGGAVRAARVPSLIALSGARTFFPIYSRPEEDQADAYAVEMLRAAGIPKESLITALVKTDAESIWFGESGPSFWDTHPPIEHRIARILAQ